MSKKYHTVAVSQSDIEWAIANDPKRRKRGAPFLREMLHLGMRTFQESHSSPPVRPVPLKRRIPLKPLRASKPILPYLIDKQSGNPKRTDKWFINWKRKEELDRLHRNNRVELILAVCGVRVCRLFYDPVHWEETDVNAIDGETYWCLDLSSGQKTKKTSDGGLQLLVEWFI